jgi:hypothetical protein
MSTSITITLPADVLESQVAGKAFQIVPSELPNATLVKMMEYAAQRLINDRAKGDNDADRHTAAEKVVASMLDGSCAESSRGASVPVETRAARNVAEAIFRRKATAEQKKAFNAMKTSEKNARLDSIVEKNADKLKAAIAAEAKRLRAKPDVELDIDI